MFLDELERAVFAIEKDVLTFTVNTPDDIHRLVSRKCQAEGARKLFTQFQTALQTLSQEKQTNDSDKHPHHT